jgi:hypothetical protein
VAESSARAAQAGDVVFPPVVPRQYPCLKQNFEDLAVQQIASQPCYDKRCADAAALLAGHFFNAAEVIRTP